MRKVGKYRAFRNLPIGWLTHANHSRDKTERLFHWGLEALLFLSLSLGIAVINSVSLFSWQVILSAFIATHTLWWLINGNLHVYLLDSFKCFNNAGIYKVVDYITWVTTLLTKTGAVDAVLIYGSFCRSQFHGRSDLDLRIIRRPHARNTLKLFYLAIFARIASLFSKIPTDLQVVDSYSFLQKQMRKDELPVVAYCREGFKIGRTGISFKLIAEDPSLVLKHKYIDN
ncbi:MAG: hypothetical protein PHD01_05735 [Geobacteraceae bacterium]|nr:hypothetical protein [Geobacteraceae bacterium]